MKRRILAFVTALVMVVTMLPASAFAEGTTWGSDYDTATEFTISNEDELRAFAKMANEGKDFAGKTVKLTENIVLTEEQWIPIAAKANTFFAGTFDGKGNTISGLTLTLEAPTPDVAFPGLFGKVSGTIQNVILEDINISSPQPNGGIASVLKDGTIDSCSVSGQIQVTANNQGKFLGLAGGIVAMVQSSGTIKNCKNEADLSSQGGIVAGIAGRVAKTTITNCTNYGDIEGRNYLGGIVGQLDGTVSGCENNGTVTSNASTEESLNYDIGGIAGNATVEDEVSDCINNGAVTAEHCNRVGGIVGYLYAGSDVTNCKNTASVTGNEGIGGVVGYAAPDAGATANFDYGYSIISCANSGSVSGEKNVGGVVGIARGVTSQNESMEGLALEVSSCTNKATVSGTTNVGGIVGSNNAVSDTEKYGIKTATEVSGCINTGRVPAGAGAIVGNNNDIGVSGSEKKAGIVKNNFWPEEIGQNAVGSGAGSSGSDSDNVKNNSSYDENGKLNNDSVTDNEGNPITDMSGSCDKLFGGHKEADNWITVREATCSAEGVKVKYCVRCNSVADRESIPKTPHTFSNGICAVCGAADPDYVPDPPVVVYPVISHIAPIAEQEYTGKAIEPAVTVYDRDGDVITSNNYTVTYTNNIEPGTATVTVTGKAGILGSATATFTIVKTEQPEPPQPPQPEKPGKVEITDTSSDFGRIRVYFDKVAAVGDNTMRYQIQSQKVGSDVVKTQYATVGYSYATVRDLAYNAKYNIKIRAYYIDENGERIYGDWSEVKTVYANRLGTSNQVMYKAGITKLTAGKTSVAVNLKKVAFTKNPVKITYQIAYRKNGAAKFSYAYTTNVKKTVYNLSENTNYQFKVRYYYRSLVDDKLVFSSYTPLKTVKTLR